MRVPNLLPKIAARRKKRRLGSAIDVQLAAPYAPDGERVEPFLKFSHDWIKILDKEVRPPRVIPFCLFPAQARIAGFLVRGEWLVVLKARQLGFTWLCAAFVVWNMVFRDFFSAMCIAQPGGYAEDFAARVRFMLDRLPGWFGVRVVKDSTGDGILRLANGAELRVLAPGMGKRHQTASGRSFTGDFALIDEGAFVPGLQGILGGLTPGMTRSENRAADGLIVTMSTGDGPAGDFFELWNDTYGTHGELLTDGRGPNGYRPVFVPWWERPGRTPEWYADQVGKLGSVRVKREYPASSEEAFAHAAGRVYALFTAGRNVGRMEIPPYAQRCRAIDWGESKSAYVVLWLAYIPGPPGFLISPDCPNAIREFLGYRFDDVEKGRIMKRDDHACDAVRYAVVRHRMNGLVYVYREIYRLNAVEAGWNPLREIEEIHELSGWRRSRPQERGHFQRGAKGEAYDLPAVADRSMGKIINLFNEFDIPTVPSATIRGMKSDGAASKDRPIEEVIEGVRMVAALIDGSIDMGRYYELAPAAPPAASPAPAGKRGRGAALLQRLKALRAAGGPT